MRRLDWTKAEKAVVRRWCMALRSNRATAPTAQEVANQLHRNVWSIRKLAKKMGWHIPRREWTMREVAILRDWYNSTREDCSLAELAKRLGRTRDALVDQALKMGFTRRNYSEKAPESEVSRLRAWHHAGWSMHEMARSLGVSRTVVRRWLLSLNLPINERKRRTARATRKALQTVMRKIHEDGYSDLREAVQERKRVQAYFRWPGAESPSECAVLDALHKDGPGSSMTVSKRIGRYIGRARRLLRKLVERGMVTAEWESFSQGQRKIYRLAVDTLPYNEHRRRELEKGERIPSVSQRDRDYLVMHRVGL